MSLLQSCCGVCRLSRGRISVTRLGRLILIVLFASVSLLLVSLLWVLRFRLSLELCSHSHFYFDDVHFGVPGLSPDGRATIVREARTRVSIGGTRPGLAFHVISDATARRMYNGCTLPDSPFIHVMRFQTVFDCLTKRFDKPALRSLHGWLCAPSKHPTTPGATRRSRRQATQPQQGQHD